MRWQGQTVAADEQGRLPNVDTAVVRRFDAPEALQTRFYEIRAKSALNRVPPQSRVPFEWTVNPYRGCSHACVYCVHGDTRVLIGYGRALPMRELRPGHEIVGTVRHGARRRYVRTTVVDHWTVRRPAYRVRLENGTTLIVGGDHRLLSDHGWSYVTGSGDGPERRPGLAPGTRLLGPGALGDAVLAADAGASMIAAAAPAGHDHRRTGAPSGAPVAPVRRVVGRSRTMEGRAVGSARGLRVAEVEPLGLELPLFDITTGTGDYVAEGVIHHNCFARPTHEYLDLDAGRDFEREIIVKVNVPEVLRKELARPSWKRAHIAMGTNTDPYQWVEGRYRLMRGIWEVLRDAANPCSILTKSPLLLRDLDLMQEIAERTEITACLSVPTIDEGAWRASEPHTPHPRARLEAVAKLNAAGIPTGILIAPLLPGINDDPEQVEEIIRLAGEAGAVSIGGQTLFLRGSVRDVYFDWLRSYRPDLVPRYERLYARGAYVPEPERRTIERAAGLPKAMFSRRRRKRFAPPAGAGAEPPGRGDPRAAGAPEPARQGSLF